MRYRESGVLQGTGRVVYCEVQGEWCIVRYRESGEL